MNEIVKNNILAEMGKIELYNFVTHQMDEFEVFPRGGVLASYLPQDRETQDIFMKKYMLDGDSLIAFAETLLNLYKVLGVSHDLE